MQTLKIRPSEYRTQGGVIFRHPMWMSANPPPKMDSGDVVAIHHRFNNSKIGFKRKNNIGFKYKHIFFLIIHPPPHK